MDCVAFRRSSSALELVESFQHGIDVGVENQWGTLLGCEDGGFSFVGSAVKKVAAVELQSELRVFQDVSREYQDDGFVRMHESLLRQFLQPRKRDGGSGLAADAVGTDLGFRERDFDFADLFDNA